MGAYKRGFGAVVVIKGSLLLRIHSLSQRFLCILVTTFFRLLISPYALRQHAFLTPQRLRPERPIARQPRTPTRTSRDQQRRIATHRPLRHGANLHRSHQYAPVSFQPEKKKLHTY
jgi:hypothetical protein